MQEWSAALLYAAYSMTFKNLTAMAWFLKNQVGAPCLVKEVSCRDLLEHICSQVLLSLLGADCIIC